jgi:hypothetical protein
MHFLRRHYPDQVLGSVEASTLSAHRAGELPVSNVGSTLPTARRSVSSGLEWVLGVWSHGLVEDVGERIEIELVPNDEPADRHRRPLRRRHPDTGGDPGEHGDDGAHDDADDASRERRRLIAVAVSVGVVALLLGWTLGRGGRDDAPAAADPETTTPPTTTRATVPADDTIAPVDEPATTVYRPPFVAPRTATDLVEEGAHIEVEAVAVDPRLAGSGLRMVGHHGFAAELVEIDVDAGTATTFELDGLPPEPGGSLAVGDDWVVIPVYDGGSAFVIHVDGSVERASLQPDGSNLLFVPTVERFWRMATVFRGGGMTVEEVGLDGEPTGVEVELPINAWPAMADPAGGVIVQSSGRWFSIDPAGAEPLGVGEMVAIDDTMALLYDCPELDHCGLWRTDRATGERAEVPGNVARDERYLSTAWWNADAGSGISPDRRRVAVMVDDGTGSGGLVIIDIESGEVTDVPLRGGGPPMVVWSPDGAFIVFLDGGGVPTAYALASGETFPVVTDSSLSGWSSLGRRP